MAEQRKSMTSDHVRMISTIRLGERRHNDPFNTHLFDSMDFKLVPSGVASRIMRDNPGV